MATTEPEPEIEDLVTGDAHSDARCIHSVAVHGADGKRVRDVRESLLVWYDAHRRKLPWRGDAPPYVSTATHTKQAQATKTTPNRAASMMEAFVVRADVPSKREEVKVEHVEVEHETTPRKVTPYETWVSEIMLQQTRVDTVVDYFLKWTEKFPTVEALASASEEDVNALWAGLGYYRRARMLHAGAKYVMEHFNGELPSSTEQLLTIPGIGPYTAGAISSIAFGNQEPLVDGNVIRVVARLRAVGADSKNKQLVNFSWKCARELVEECDRPCALNQALMELGATVCTVQNPQCASCPVRASCLAYEEYTTTREKANVVDGSEVECDLCDTSRTDEWLGQRNRFEVTRYPLKTKKSESKNDVICVAVVSHELEATNPVDDPQQSWRFLMTKRPAGGLLAGQWEFVNSKVADSASIPAYSQRKTHMKQRLSQMFASSSVLSASNAALDRRDLGELTHIFSHVKHHMGIEHLHFSELPPLARSVANDSANVRWMSLEDMQKLGITTGVKKILHLVLKGNSSTKKAAVKEKSNSKRPTAKRSSTAEPNTEKRVTTARKTRSSTTVSTSHSPVKKLKTIQSFFK